MNWLLNRYHTKLFSAALFAAFMITAGCGGYYNTFYNTKKVYKEALDEQKRRTTDKPGSGEIQKYDKAIEKASKLLQLHPKSRYVDDALFLIGECFYYKQEYLKAQRKFQELLALFPKSGFVPRAQFWLAKTNIELNDFAGAEQVLKELQQREKKGEMVDQARYLLGEIYFRRKEFIPAAKEYEAAARQLDDDKIRSEAYRRLGECGMELKQFALAADAFRRAGSSHNDLNLKFAARLQYGLALKKDNKSNEALNAFNSMAKEFSAHRDLPLVKLEIAECTSLQGKIESAMRQYTAIIENHQRTEASAAAYFALGEMHERYTGDFAKAKENYDNVRRESSRSEKLAEADRRSKAITSLIKLKETVATLERQRRAPADEKAEVTRRLADNKDKKSSEERRPISHIPRRARNVDPAMLAAKSAASAAAKDPNKIAAELAKSKILLAELYLFNFNRPDSAMQEYLDVFEFFPQTEYAPQAMYSLAYILGEAPATLAMRDSILQVLAGKYSSTPQGQRAKRHLRLADTLAAAPTVPELFRRAEENLIREKDAQKALRLYQEFLQRQPDSKYAAQSLYAMGWIYEHELSDNKQALATYKKLIETFPDSPMARRVRPKVTAVEQPAKPNLAAPSSVPPSLSPATEKPDTLMVEDDDVPRKNIQQRRTLLEEELNKQDDDNEKKAPPDSLMNDEKPPPDNAKKENDKRKEDEKPPEPPEF